MLYRLLALVGNIAQSIKPGLNSLQLAACQRQRRFCILHDGE
jgi:hypothetical protein